jgi:hypothetical protein
MANKMMHIRMPEQLFLQSKALAKELGFSNTQEFFRNSVRNAIQEYENKILFKKLKALQGSSPPTRRLTHKEREELIYEFLEEKKNGRDIFKEYGLK